MLATDRQRENLVLIYHSFTAEFAIECAIHKRQCERGLMVSRQGPISGHRSDMATPGQPLLDPHCVIYTDEAFRPPRGAVTRSGV